MEKKTLQLRALHEKDNCWSVKMEHVTEFLWASVYERMKHENI